MSKVTFDTNVFITYPNVELPDSFYMSIVVLQELLVGAEDDTEIKHLNRARIEYAKAERLLVPDAEDWWQVGRIINALQRGKKANQGGKTPKLGSLEKYRLTNDVLIPRTAKKAGVAIVSDNLKDFEFIQRFCKVRVISAAQYFNS
jgi:predicted nucleic acid-binding protein